MTLITNTEINWCVPNDIINNPAYTKVEIWRSTSENSGYTLLTEIDLRDNQSNLVTSYVDSTVPAINKEGYFYLVTFKDPVADKETKFFLTLYSSTPREERLLTSIRQFSGTFITQHLSDNDLRLGMKMSISAYNVYAPSTTYDINNFPNAHEVILILGAALYAILFKYLQVAISDFVYSDAGFTLQTDRGEKIQKAIANVLDLWRQLIVFAKMDQMFAGGGVGTYQLPVSIGGSLNRGLLNVLDVFQSLGR